MWSSNSLEVKAKNSEEMMDLIVIGRWQNNVLNQPIVKKENVPPILEKLAKKKGNKG
jgi:hypothetical protein